MPSPSPLRATDRLRDRLTEAVLAQASFNDLGLINFLRQHLRGNDKAHGALVADPFVEGVAPYVAAPITLGELAGTLLHPGVIEALTRGEPGEDYRFDPAMRPYAHQLEAWQHLLQPRPRSLVVTSGTGSGKTECFLVPLLHDLLANAAGQSGVRAIVLYPLNALIASQQARLRRWMAPFKGRIRFGLYNGLTREEAKVIDDRPYPEEARSRSVIRQTPPQVLVTNVSMMEYLTIRRKDRPLLENSRGSLRWIIIDEAHSYVGSAAAEVALLLRRVIMAFGVEPSQVRFVATSATIGSGEGVKAALARFLADLACVAPEQVHVVEGHRTTVDLPEPTRTGALPHDALHRPTLLARHPAVQAFIREAENAPVSLSRAAALLRPVGLEPADIMEAVASSESGAPLLPLRVHQFMRAVPGLWSCVNAACTGPKPAGWPFGAPLFGRADSCPACRGRVFEVTRCAECGEPFLAAFQRGDVLGAGQSAPDEDEFAAASERAGAEDEEVETGEGVPGQQPDSTEAAEEAQPPATGIRRLLSTRRLDGLHALSLDPLNGCLLDRAGEGQAVAATRCGGEICPHCRAKAKSGETVDRPFRFGAPFLVGNAVPIALECVPDFPEPKQVLPAGGRGLLSFSDSRQGTARFAAGVETVAERSYVRAILFHMAQKAARSGAKSADLAQLDSTIAALEQAVAKLPSLEPHLSDQRQKRESLLREAQAGVCWDEAARSIGQDPHVNHWMRAVWRDRDARFRQSETALGQFLMLRELARRPRRANAAETLGLAQLRFEAIEKRGAADVPDPLREVGVSVEGWRDFLYLLLDTPVRSSFAIKMDDDDVRWLVTRGGRRRNLVGPGKPKNDPTDLAWPQARSGGNQSSAVLWLERRLGFEAANGRDRAAMNEALEAAWVQLGPLFETAGADRSLDLSRSRIAPVTQAWLCPVTRRVLTRLAFGRTPYGHRERSPNADQVPHALIFPALPVVFPDTEERATVESWLHTDPAVAALRERGVWGDFHDRAALLSPFMRAEEHSAQQPPYRLRKFEEEFKDGKINLLACSTTMEMGVDIGSVSAVLMTNVPPSIANYRQRVGRAGRRGQGFASSLTFARAMPLDQAAFLDPAVYLGSSLLPPDVRLDSSRIVQRHVNALLLARWFAREGGELLRMIVGGFFGLPEQKDGAHDPSSPAAAFCAWLNEPSAARAVAHDLEQLVRGSALQGRSDLLTKAAEMFEARASTLHGQWRALQDELRQAPSEAAGRSIAMSLRRLCREALLKELANAALLPGHGFPTSVVPFEIDHEATGPESDEGGARNRRYDSPSRNADVALREYAPGAQVVIDGLVWTSAGLTLNWQRPAQESAVRDIQSLRWHWRCTRCGAADCERIKIEACPACAAPLETTRFIEPAGFRVDAAAQPNADTDQVQFIPCRPARISTRRAAWEPLLDPRLGRGRVSAEGQVFHSTGGASGGGFHICLACGRAAEDRPTLADHAPIWSAGERSGRRSRRPPRCQGNDESFTIIGPIDLGYELQTDVAELQPVMLEEQGGAIALAVALREAHARRLGINPRELGFAAEKRRGTLGQPTHSVFLFDCNAGGAGFATRMLSDVPGLLREARRILDCQTPGCERGCPACVITGDMTEPQQRLVDRRPALACLTQMEAGFAVMPEADRAAAGARLSRPVADDLVRQMAQGAVVTVFAHEPFDLGALDRLPFAALFEAAKRAGAACRVALPAPVLTGLNDVERRGLRDAAIRGGAAIVSASPDAAPNGARLLATLSQRGTVVAWFTRDAAATCFDGGWGVGVQHAVVEADVAAGPSCMPVRPEELEPKPALHSSIAVIENTKPWIFNRFGAELIKLLRPHLEAVDLWRPGELTSLSYSDRYLHSPLAAGLALHALARLRLELAPKPGLIPLNLQSSVRASDLSKPPYALHHDWQRTGDREAVLTSLAQALGMDLTIAVNGTQHARVLTLCYGKEQGCLYLDQGFGYWRANNSTKFEFAAKPPLQAKALQISTTAVTGIGHSYIAVRRVQ